MFNIWIVANFISSPPFGLFFNVSVSWYNFWISFCIISISAVVPLSMLICSSIVIIVFLIALKSYSPILSIFSLVIEFSTWFSIFSITFATPSLISNSFHSSFIILILWSIFFIFLFDSFILPSKLDTLLFKFNISFLFTLISLKELSILNLCSSSLPNIVTSVFLLSCKESTIIALSTLVIISCIIWFTSIASRSRSTLSNISKFLSPISIKEFFCSFNFLFISWTLSIVLVMKSFKFSLKSVPLFLIS